jgi:saccharopine dehydrogenase-like NADP-dependent oxidoreductase
MAKDLSKNHEVTSIDISKKNLDKLEGIRTICADISDKNTLQDLIKDFDLVVGAVPGFMGYKMMKDVIEAGKNIVDISFYPEDPFGLDKLAKQKEVVAVMDCGVAPGMGNIIFGYHDLNMEINDYECLSWRSPRKTSRTHIFLNHING